MPTNLIFTQDSFEGGVNLLSLDTRIGPTQYKIGINLRSRFGYLKPVKEPIEISGGLPEEVQNVQGLYAFGDILVLFADGLAYYKTSFTDNFIPVVGFSMDADVNRIYATAVPEASLKYLRKNVSGSLPSAGVTLEDTTSTATSVALVCQDGVNQPRLILPNGTTRLAKTYAEWDTATREYVPVGKQMVFFNNILFIVAADGRSVYRSVSGRPLDFVVAVDNNADKVSDATNTSFAVDSNQIKMLSQLNTTSLIIITAYSAYAVTLNYTNKWFDEPTFDQTFLFAAGVSNQFSFADILGDFAFIDKEGLRSFNAVSQLTFEGNNSVFSLSVAELFKNILQDDPCCGSFDNYTFFGVRTSYSPNSVLVYDNIKKVFDSVDIITPQPVKQFASTYTASRQRFFAATSKKVYEIYSEDAENYKAAVLFTRAFNSRNTDQGATYTVAELKTALISLSFEESPEAGYVQVSEMVNGKIQAANYNRPIYAFSGGVLYPVTGPCIATLRNNITPIDIPVKSVGGQKLSYVLMWTGGGKLAQMQITAQSDQSPTSTQQQSKIYS